MQDYCWDDQGYSVLSTFSPDLAGLLDDKFRSAKALLDKSEENTKLVTAVWNFVQVSSTIDDVYFLFEDDLISM